MQSNPGQNGRASLHVSLVFNQSTITAAYASTPMKLLTPRSRGASVCAYVSNFGGGLVAGDQTRLDLHLGSGARCFVGTQASTKVYRNPSHLACEHVTQGSIEANALLVFAPAPVQPFAESSYSQRQVFHLGPGAGLVLLDWFISGRRARGERWAFAHFDTRNEVWRSADGDQGSVEQQLAGVDHDRDSTECLFIDSLRLDPSEGALGSSFRAGRFNCFAMLLLLGAPVEHLGLQLLQETKHFPVERQAGLMVSASPLKQGAVLRVAGQEFTQVESFLRVQLARLKDLLGEEPWSRRW